MAENESKTLWVAALALVAFAGMMVWMLAGPGEATDEEPPSAAAEPEPNAPPAAAAPAQPGGEAAAERESAEPTAADPVAAAIDPMVDVFAGPMPDFMADLQRLVLDKKPLSAKAQKLLYDFGQEHKDDARPQLLLAWDSMNHEWDGIAVRMYRIAFRADPRAKNDPRMLADLISVGSRFERTEHREATAIIIEAYGASALPAIDEEIARLRDRGELTRSARLERVRTAVKQAAAK